MDVFFANMTNISAQSSRRVWIGRVSIVDNLVGFGEETEEMK